MSEHTPGPWQWWTSNSWRRLSGPDRKDGGVLCPYVARDGHPDLMVSSADASLIEAAPDLFDALEPFDDALGEDDSEYPDDTPIVLTFGRVTVAGLSLGDFRRARAARRKADP